MKKNLSWKIENVPLRFEIALNKRRGAARSEVQTHKQLYGQTVVGKVIVGGEKSFLEY